MQWWRLIPGIAAVLLYVLNAQAGNPACPYGTSRVEADSKAHFEKRFPNSHELQQKLHNENMQAYRQVCELTLPPELDGSLSTLFDRYYPSYSAIELLLGSEIQAHRQRHNGD